MTEDGVFFFVDQMIICSDEYNFCPSQIDSVVMQRSAVEECVVRLPNPENENGKIP